MGIFNSHSQSTDPQTKIAFLIPSSASISSQCISPTQSTISRTQPLLLLKILYHSFQILLKRSKQFFMSTTEVAFCICKYRRDKRMRIRRGLTILALFRSFRFSPSPPAYVYEKNFWEGEIIVVVKKGEAEATVAMSVKYVQKRSYFLFFNLTVLCPYQKNNFIM